MKIIPPQPELDSIVEVLRKLSRDTPVLDTLQVGDKSYRFQCNRKKRNRIAVVGDPLWNSGQGIAYVFQSDRSGKKWEHVDTLRTGKDVSQFGSGVYVSSDGEVIVVSASIITKNKNTISITSTWVRNGKHWDRSFIIPFF